MLAPKQTRLGGGGRVVDYFNTIYSKRYSTLLEFHHPVKKKPESSSTLKILDSCFILLLQTNMADIRNDPEAESRQQNLAQDHVCFQISTSSLMKSK